MALIKMFDLNACIGTIFRTQVAFVRRNWPNVTSRFIPILAGAFILSFSANWPFAPYVCLAATEAKRLSAVASAQNSAPGYDPSQAVDENESTLWVASLKPHGSNNNVWFQLDLGEVRQIARLHWLAATGAPYPASMPNKYRVLVSADGSDWLAISDATKEGVNEQRGDVLLNTDARYVRLETTKVNDGTGWALGLREIWVTEGRDIRSMWRVKGVLSAGSVKINWQTPSNPQIKQLTVYRASSPAEMQGVPVATLAARATEYIDKVPNWTPYYYWIKAIDNKGVVLDTSAKIAAFAHPKVNVADRVESFAFWYEPYKPSIAPDASIRHIGKAAFVVGAGDSATADLAKMGIGTLPYITLYQSAQAGMAFPKDSDSKVVAAKLAPIAFYKNDLQFPGSPAGYLPSVFSRPENVEYKPKSIQYTTCPNSVAFRDMVLSFTSKQLATGVAGFFVDNGYEDDIAAYSVCQSPGHAHYYGNNLTSADAFLGMLLEITCAVKKQNPRGILLVNGSVPPRSSYYGLRLAEVSDGRLWESYLRSSHSTAKEHASDWDSVYRKSLELEKAWLADPPQPTYVLSYPWDRNEAFFCYATAKLFNLPWSAGLGISDPQHSQFGGHFGSYPELVDLRLGAPVASNQYGGEKIGEVYLRRYEKGMVVVNPTRKAQNFFLSLGKRFKLRDLFADKEYSADNISQELPAESGRVYLYK